MQVCLLRASRWRCDQRIALRLSVSRLRVNWLGKRNLIIIGKIRSMQVASHSCCKLQLTIFSRIRIKRHPSPTPRDCSSIYHPRPFHLYFPVQTKILHNRNLGPFAFASDEAVAYVLIAGIPHNGPHRVERAGLFCLLLHQMMKMKMKTKYCG